MAHLTLWNMLEVLPRWARLQVTNSLPLSWFYTPPAQWLSNNRVVRWRNTLMHCCLNSFWKNKTCCSTIERMLVRSETLRVPLKVLFCLFPLEEIKHVPFLPFNVSPIHSVKWILPFSSVYRDLKLFPIKRQCLWWRHFSGCINVMVCCRTQEIAKISVKDTSFGGFEAFVDDVLEGQPLLQSCHAEDL